MSYAAAKAASKEPEKFGKGSIDGLMAAETGDMSSIPGHIIPCLALGIPGSAPSAVLMAAMIIHGVQPGPMLMIQNPQFVPRGAMTTLASVAIGCSAVRRASAAARAAGAARDPDAMRVPAVHGGRTPPLAPVRIYDAGHRHRGLLPAPARATRWRRWCWACCSAPAGQEPAPRLVLSDGSSCLPSPARSRWGLRRSPASRSCFYFKPFKAAVQRLKNGFSGDRALFARGT